MTPKGEIAFWGAIPPRTAALRAQFIVITPRNVVTRVETRARNAVSKPLPIISIVDVMHVPCDFGIPPILVSIPC